MWRDKIFKTTIKIENLHQNINDNGVCVVNFATPKYLVCNSTMFLHGNIRKYTGASPGGEKSQPGI